MLANCWALDSGWRHNSGGFLSPGERLALIALARDGSVTNRLARRASALVLLDGGMSCEQVAQVLFLDDDTVRRWHRAFAEGGRKALMRFAAGGSACALNDEQQAELIASVRSTAPRSTRHVGAWIASQFGVAYESRSGLVALLHRLGLEYRKPEVIPRRLDEAKQRAFIELYENLLNSLAPDEAVLFVDAVHPTHAARAAGCWTAKDARPAIKQTTGRQRLNIHGAIDLETGQTRMIEAQPSTPPRRSNSWRVWRRSTPRPSRSMCFSTIALSSRQDRPGVAIPTGTTDRAAFRSILLPASQSHRAVMGADAPTSHAQQNLSDMSGIRRRNPRLPPRRGPQEMGRILRFGHR